MVSTLDYPTAFEILENYESEDFSSYCNVSIQPSVKFEDCVNKSSPNTKNKQNKSVPKKDSKVKPELDNNTVSKFNSKPTVEDLEKEKQRKIKNLGNTMNPSTTVVDQDLTSTKKVSKEFKGKNKLPPISLSTYKEKNFIKFVSPINSGSSTPKLEIANNQISKTDGNESNPHFVKIDNFDTGPPLLTKDGIVQQNSVDVTKKDLLKGNSETKTSNLSSLDDQFFEPRVYLPRKVDSDFDSTENKVDNPIDIEHNLVDNILTTQVDSVIEFKPKRASVNNNKANNTIEEIDQKIHSCEDLLISTSDIKEELNSKETDQIINELDNVKLPQIHTSKPMSTRFENPNTIDELTPLPKLVSQLNINVKEFVPKSKPFKKKDEVEQSQTFVNKPTSDNLEYTSLTVELISNNPAAKISNKKGMAKSFVISSNGTLKTFLEFKPEQTDETLNNAENKTEDTDLSESGLTESSSSKSNGNKNNVKANKSSGSNIKIPFRTYVTGDKLTAGIDSGKYVVGKVYIAKQNCNMAFIQVEGVENDVYCDGSLGKNRAFHNDTVAFEYLDEKMQAKLYSKNRVIPTLVKDRNLKIVKVVAIMEPNCPDGENLLGTLLISDKTKHMVRQDITFKPINQRFPKILIKAQDIPEDVFEHTYKYINCLCRIIITGWSAEDELPSGKFLESMGPLGKLTTDVTAVLTSNNIYDNEFTENTLKSLPNLPYSISDDEMKNRHDLRAKCIFTVDPPTAKDLDDALSIEPVEGGYRVGVHIADVSHYIEEGTDLDKEAHRRSTTVYLMDRNIPMLPRLLCDELCSLVPHKDRLTFTCQFLLDPEANIVKVHFFKSIIKSCAKLSYNQAQAVIDGHDLEAQVSEPHTLFDVKQGILDMHNLAQILRKRRFANGAVDIQSKDLSFDLDADGMPTDVHEHKTGSANHMIEEFMLLANEAVAKQLSQHLPEYAMLRCHPGPNPDKWLALQEVTKQLGYSFDFGKDWHHQIANIADVTHKETLMHLTVCCMRPAQYFRSGSRSEENSGHHFGLNLDYYTHFTSPIRRYPDLVVHRQLMVTIGQAYLPDGDLVGQLDAAAKRSNEAKITTRRIKDDLTEVYLAHLLQSQEKSPDSTKAYDAIIVQINSDKGNLVLLVLELDLELRVTVNDLLAKPKFVKLTKKQLNKLKTKKNAQTTAEKGSNRAESRLKENQTENLDQQSTNSDEQIEAKDNKLLTEDSSAPELVSENNSVVEVEDKPEPETKPVPKFSLFDKIQVHLKVECTFPTIIKPTLVQ